MVKAQDNYTKLILDAEWIILNHGLDTLSIRNLAKHAGVSVGYLYNYFENKDALLKALIDHFYKTQLHDEICTLDHKLSFVDYIDKLLHILNNKTYFKLIYNALNTDFKQHFHDGLLAIFKQDQSIRRTHLDTIDENDLISTLVDHMLYELSLPQPRLDVLMLFISRTLQ